MSSLWGGGMQRMQLHHSYKPNYIASNPIIVIKRQ